MLEVLGWRDLNNLLLDPKFPLFDSSVMILCRFLFHKVSLLKARLSSLVAPERLPLTRSIFFFLLGLPGVWWGWAPNKTGTITYDNGTGEGCADWV